MEGRQMVQWDKDSCADAGFLKIDLLGLGMLSAVERCVELIARRRGETVDLSRIPFDDAETYGAIQRAETTGVFQIESRAQMGSLRRTRPESLDDLTIQVAIVRPGPIVGGAVNPYIERRQRLRADPRYEVPYDHPSLEPVLRDTLGTIIFQDQVLEVAQAFAGFSVGEAEGLRRAMSRKRSAAAIESHHRRFVDGAMARHADVDEALAERVWHMVVGFSGFGFPKAHGAAFGLLAYQSTWLRVHYGPEFLCALLDEQPMGFYPPDALVHEAQRRGIEILPPDVNRSAAGCTVTPEGAVQVGLGYVMGVRRDEVEALVAERERSGPFRSIEDLASRAGAGRPALEQLAWAGACDRLVFETVGAAAPSDGEPSGDESGRSGVATATPPGAVARRTALWQLGVAAPAVPVGEHGMQLSLALDLPQPPVLRALDDWDALVADYATTGMAIAHHPFELLRPHLKRQGLVSSEDLQSLRHGAEVRIGGLVMARQRPATANGVCFLLLEDEFGTLNLVVPPPVYERDRLAVRSEPLVVADGRLERYASAGGAINFVVRRLRALDVPVGEIAEVHDLPTRARRHLEPVPDDTVMEPAAVVAGSSGSFRAVAPPVQSFARGRSR
jgi:error-prone DNA polymerase